MARECSLSRRPGRECGRPWRELGWRALAGCGRGSTRDLSMSVASTTATVPFGRDLLRLAVESVGFLVLGFAAVVFVILVLLKSLLGLAASSANLGLLPGPDSGASNGPLAAIIPADQLAVMEQVAAATPCAIPWSVLAGVAYIESDFGQNLGPSSAGAYGYAQFLPGTWASYGGNVPWRTSDPARAGQGAVAAAGLQQLSLRATGHGSVSVRDGRGVRRRLVSGRR